MNPLILLLIGGAAMALGGRRTGRPPAKRGYFVAGGGGTPDTGAEIPSGWLPYFSAPGTPKSGTFYPVTEVDLEDEYGNAYDNPLWSIAKMVLYGQRTAGTMSGLVASGKFATCIQNSDWNGWYFGADTAKAFDPVNANAMDDIARKVWPRVGAQGIGAAASISVAAGNSLGLMWLPPVYSDLFSGETVCPLGYWASGRLTINPPDAILAELSGTVPQWAQQGVVP